MSNHRTLEVWQISNELAKNVHRLRGRLPARERWVLGEQTWRAALSVPCNIVEGYARSTPPQLKYHLNVAIGSLAETDYLLGLIPELGVAATDEVAPSIALAQTLQPRLTAFLRAVDEGRARHSRFGPR